NGFFSRQFSVFFKYEFKSLTLRFDDHRTILIRKAAQPDLFVKEASDADVSSEIDIILDSPDERPNPFRLKATTSVPPLNRSLPFIEPAGLDMWLDENTDELLSTAE